MQLSTNLSLAEMVNSSTAKRKGISNQPTEQHLSAMKLLALRIFQPIREHFGVPIHISSGYRSAALNKAIGGASSSQHSKGEAIDIDMDNTDITNAEVFNFIRENLPFDQLLWEFGTAENPDWVHVSYSPTGKQRGQVLKAVKNGSKTVYQVYA